MRMADGVQMYAEVSVEEVVRLHGILSGIVMD